jgi:bacterial/archaeal transporter family protein
MAITDVAVGLLCALTWACGSILTRDLARKLDPFTLNAPRMLVGGLAMLAATLATGRQSGYALLTPERLLYLIGSMIIGGGLGDALYVTSMARIGVCRSFPIANAYPALTLIIGVLFLHEAVSVPMVAGLCLVIGGIYLVGRPSQDPLAATAVRTDSSGVTMAMMAAVCWAGSMALVAPGLQGLDPIMVASVRTPAMALILWGIVAARRTWPQLAALSRREWIVIVVGGLVGWGLGSVLFLLAVSLAGPTRAAILTATSPLFALPLGVAFLRERVNLVILAGTALTVLGVVLVAQS